MVRSMYPEGDVSVIVLGKHLCGSGTDSAIQHIGKIRTQSVFLKVCPSLRVSPCFRECHFAGFDYASCLSVWFCAF